MPAFIPSGGHAFVKLPVYSEPMIAALIINASWLCFPVAGLLAYVIVRHTGVIRWLAAALLALTGLFIWGRYIEPRILTVHEETIFLPGASEDSPSIRIALFSDTHLGMFGNAIPMRRIADRINMQKVDAVFLAGDITFHPDAEDIPSLIAPLGDLDAPLYAVLGNHDVGRPGPDLSNPVMAALDATDATLVQNRAFDVTLGGQRVIVSGASDLWQMQQDFSFSADLPEGIPVLLLTHNPDTARFVPDVFEYSLMLAGHTHGGQIRLPFVYKHFIPTNWPFDKELHVFPSDGGDRLIYVSSGTGMSGLPIRLFIPPRIDVLTLHLPE